MYVTHLQSINPNDRLLYKKELNRDVKRKSNEKQEDVGGISKAFKKKKKLSIVRVIQKEFKGEGGNGNKR